MKKPWHLTEKGKQYHKTYFRAWRERNKKRLAEKARLRRKDPNEFFKIKAREELRDLIKRGLLVRGSCEVCGEKDAHAHHEDYSKPLDVRWFCRKHHDELHLGKSS